MPQGRLRARGGVSVGSRSQKWCSRPSTASTQDGSGAAASDAAHNKRVPFSNRSGHRCRLNAIFAIGFGVAVVKCEGMGHPGNDSPHSTAYCEVVCWRGYVTLRFVARRDDGALVDQSHPFLWTRANPPPDTTRRARRAYERLVERLEANGWRAVDDGELWFETGFEQDRLRPVRRRRLMPKTTSDSLT